jgi:chorismate mutase
MMEEHPTEEAIARAAFAFASAVSRSDHAAAEDWARLAFAVEEEITDDFAAAVARGEFDLAERMASFLLGDREGSDA